MCLLTAEEPAFKTGAAALLGSHCKLCPPPQGPWWDCNIVVRHHSAEWPWLSCSIPVLPPKGWLNKRHLCVHTCVCSPSMSSWVFPHFRELVLACFSSGRYSTLLGTGWQKHCRTLLGIGETCCSGIFKITFTCVHMRSVSSLFVLKMMFSWGKKARWRKRPPKIPCQYHTTSLF